MKRVVVICVPVEPDHPFFDDMNITDIVSPDGWASSIEQVGVANSATGWDGIVSWFDPTDPWYPLFGPDSPFGENNLTQVLRWYCVDPRVFTGDGVFGQCGDGEETSFGTPIFPEDVFTDPTSLGGFGFDSTFSAAAAPYQASWLDLPVQSGDPAFPFAGGIPGSPSVTGASVPEPTTLALMSIGLLGALGVSRRRAKTV